MKFLVTGSAGFIGSHVAATLLRRGDTVVGVDNFNDYYDPKQKRTNAASLERDDKFQLVELDVRDQVGMQTLFRDHAFDTVIHLAAMAGVRNSIDDPELYFDVNVNGTKTLLELARIHGIRQFVLASTSSAYGSTTTIPFVESDTNAQPMQPYATSKRCAELMGQTYHQHFGINFTSLRFFTVYGPAGRPDMMPFLLANSISHGQEVQVYEGAFQRDWTYVDDIVAGVVSAVDRPLGFEVINLGRGAPKSLQSFIDLLERVAGQKANLTKKPAPATEMLTTFADISKARRLLDFNPTVSVEEGVENFWNWYVRQLSCETGESRKVAIPHLKAHLVTQSAITTQ